MLPALPICKTDELVTEPIRNWWMQMLWLM
ncbi:hypothetical protein T260_08810 [Geobacillus thermopakistaniensis]|uniref:Uncharacterized protein n=1 Tax=Geobacillus thermopakistaniensis (strain MAS1) TaxID=1408282 RepID=A0A7U9JB69_GEOTM|nr:hypothetical protein GA8_15510 [Geobacillus sp. A8]ESU72362.1 hypothetical protein T260_08810 [Geobacillus sp. MAS1]